MDYEQAHARTADGSHARDPADAPRPGKRTLTEDLVQREEPAFTAHRTGVPAPLPALSGSGPRPTLQMLFGVHRVATPAPSVDSAQVHAAAARGTAGPASALPFADRIQASFGPGHDVSAIRAHTGSAASEAATAIGATAYATGHHTVFAGAPDLHTAAHEAAHVFQQQAGVHLAGGVGQTGDAYERHADAVADLVVQGQSAAGLLAAGPGGSSPGAGPAIQRQDAPTPAPAAGATPASPPAPATPAPPSEFTEDDKKALLELNGYPMDALLTAVAGLDDKKRELYGRYLDKVPGLNPRRMTVAFRAVTARRAGTTAHDFAFSDPEMYAMCRNLGYRDQREAVFRFVEPGFQPPKLLDPGSAVKFKDGRDGIVHRGTIKRQAAKNQLPWMCNNPGALGNGPSFKSPNTYPGKTIGPAAINIYPSEADGMAGLVAWIDFQANVNHATFGGFFQAHAPADDGKAGNKGNDPDKYFRAVAGAMGLDPDKTRGTSLKTMNAAAIASAIRAVGEGYRLGGDTLSWPKDEAALDRETWFAMMYWETTAGT